MLLLVLCVAGCFGFSSGGDQDLNSRADGAAQNFGRNCSGGLDCFDAPLAARWGDVAYEISERVFNVSGPDDCAALCITTPGCLAFSFKRPGGWFVSNVSPLEASCVWFRIFLPGFGHYARCAHSMQRPRMMARTAWCKI